MAWVLLWVIGSLAGAGAWAAMCYARDLRAEREDRMRKAADLHARLAAFRSGLAGVPGQAPEREKWLEELEGLMVDAIRAGVPFDPRGQP